VTGELDAKTLEQGKIGYGLGDADDASSTAFVPA